MLPQNPRDAPVRPAKHLPDPVKRPPRLLIDFENLLFEYHLRLAFHDIATIANVSVLSRLMCE